ncbi:MAG: response regulator [Pseudobacteriovorax sp.]|nr:response regulator [Pseudobacteriovorax sp.]
MGNYQLDRKKRVLIYDQSERLKNTLGEALVSQGFSNIKYVHRVNDLLELWNLEPTSWIFSYLDDEDEFTGGHILRMCLELEYSSRPLASFFFDESQNSYVPFMMSLGMFSSHESVHSVNHITEGLEFLIQQLETHCDDTLVSAFWYKRHLIAVENYDELIVTAESLIAQFPNNPTYYVMLAEGYFLAGRKDEGSFALHKASGHGAESLDYFAEIVNTHMGRELSAQDRKLPINSCVVIDSDLASQNQIRPLLEALGVQTIQFFQNQDEALQYLLKNIDTQLILTEWKQPHIVGSCIIQRIRAAGLHATPVLIVSALVKGEDDVLLEEFGVSDVIAKPIDDRTALVAILNAVIQERFPSEFTTILRKFRLMVRGQKLREAEQLADVLQQLPECTDELKLGVLVEIKYLSGHTEEAYQLAKQAESQGGNTLYVCHLLGKICLDLHNYKEALGYLAKAKARSPLSVERLCLMAKIFDSMNQSDGAQTCLRAAKAIDGNSVLVKEASIELVKEGMNPETVESLTEDTRGSESLISYWNNKAIQAVRRKKYPEAIATYKKALSALPKGMSESRSYLRYNLALAYSRTKKLKRARVYLETLICEQESPVLDKAMALHKKIVAHITEKTPFVLNDTFHKTNDESDNSSQVDYDGIVPADSSQGNSCLNRIYFYHGALPSNYNNLLSSIPVLKKTDVVA